MVLGLAVAGALGAGVAAHAQARGGFGFREPVRLGLPKHGGVTDRGFTFCRLLYTSDRREAGGSGWSTDYPNGDANFMLRLSQLTRTGVSRFADGSPAYGVVQATDPELFQCPFLFASDVGTMALSTAEAERLREYLLKGGFLWVDDFWGELAWSQWEAQLRRVLPEYGIRDIPPDHRLFTAHFIVREVPQIPSIRFWANTGGGTSERGAESATPVLRGVFDGDRLMVFMSHNTDIADGWEREAENVDFFQQFSPRSYGLGINVVLWALTH